MLKISFKFLLTIAVLLLSMHGTQADSAAPSTTLHDTEYERFAATHSAAPDILPVLSAGTTAVRHCAVSSDAAPGTKIEIRVAPRFRTAAEKKRVLPLIAVVLNMAPKSHKDIALAVPVPAVNANAVLELPVVVLKNGKKVYRTMLVFLIVPQDKNGTQAQYVGRDDATQGNWTGRYGKQAFLVAVKDGRAAFQMPGVLLHRGNGTELRSIQLGKPVSEDEQQAGTTDFSAAESVSDVRVQRHGPGLTDRPPTAFSAFGLPLIFRAEAADGQAHVLSLYLLDYTRAGQTVTLDIFDLQGHRLESQRITHYEEGVYVRFQFTGRLLIRLWTTDAAQSVTTSALFIDPSADKR